MTDAPELSSAFPPPPSYYKNYTNENILRKQQGTTTKTSQSLSLKKHHHQDHHKLFLDPPPPIQGKFKMFGAEYEVDAGLATLKDLNIEQLFSENIDGGKGFAEELKRLNKDLLIKFMTLLRILGLVQLDKSEEKLQLIRTLLINIHHLINSYREHQAKDMIKVLLETNIQEKENAIHELENVMNQVKEMYQNISLLKDSSDSTDNQNSENMMDIDIN